MMISTQSSSKLNAANADAPTVVTRNNVNVINVTMEKRLPPPSALNSLANLSPLAEENGSSSDEVLMPPPPLPVAQPQPELVSESSSVSSRVRYVRRGNFYGALFDVDHLSTFTVGPKHGIVKAEDGIRRLRQLERNQGVWTMPCQLMIDARYIVVYDKRTGQEVEVYPLELVCDPTSVVSNEATSESAAKDLYTNIVLFVVLEDHRDNKRSPSLPTEMHLFECAPDTASTDIVDEIYRAKETRMKSVMNGSELRNIMHSYTITHVGQQNGCRTFFPASAYDSFRQHKPVPSHFSSSSQLQHTEDNGYRPLIISTKQHSDHNNNSSASLMLMRQQQQQQQRSALNSPIRPPAASRPAIQQQQSNDLYAPLPPPPPPPLPQPPHLQPQLFQQQTHQTHYQHPNMHYSYQQQPQSAAPARVETEVQALNHCFDDIERFVSRFNASLVSIRELEKKHYKCMKSASTKSKKTMSKKTNIMLDSMQAVRNQLPEANAFVDIFQKFKLSFNLLARLKAHIHSPNAPELVHFLFEPLALISNALSKEITWLIDSIAAVSSIYADVQQKQPTSSNTDMLKIEANLKALVKSIWMPLLSRDAKELLLNTLNSKEQELWFTLGDAWMVSREDVKQQPHLYTNVDLGQNYTPVFYDGWIPDLPADHHSPYAVTYTPVQYQHHYQQQPPQPTVDYSRLAYSAMAQVNAKEGGAGVLKHTRNSVDAGPNNSSNHQARRINFMVDESTLSNNTSRPAGFKNNRNPNESAASTALNYSTKQGQPLPHVNIRNYDEMKKWAVDLAYRGAKVYEVVHDRQANNEKELTIKTGELLEVLDDKRNWWKLRNFYGNIGHAPVTILRPFDFSSA